MKENVKQRLLQIALKKISYQYNSGNWYGFLTPTEMQLLVNRGAELVPITRYDGSLCIYDPQEERKSGSSECPFEFIISDEIIGLLGHDYKQRIRNEFMRHGFYDDRWKKQIKGDENAKRD